MTRSATTAPRTARKSRSVESVPSETPAGTGLIARLVNPTTKKRSGTSRVNSRFNQDVLRLISALNALRSLVIAVAEHVREPGPADVESEDGVWAEETLPDDARGFLWTLDHYLNINESHALGNEADLLPLPTPPASR